jgi:uncharacterized protein
MSEKLRKEPFPEKAGYGIVAANPIVRGELLCIWGGHIVGRGDVDRMTEAERMYVLQVEDDLFLMASPPMEPAEFINHSCEPNAGFSGQIALVALRDMAPGEEVCFDYAMSESSLFAEFDCRCGSALCRGRVRASDWLRPDLQIRYRGFFSPYLQRRIDALAEPIPVVATRRARSRRVRLATAGAATATG